MILLGPMYWSSSEHRVLVISLILLGMIIGAIFTSSYMNIFGKFFNDKKDWAGGLSNFIFDYAWIMLLATVAVLVIAYGGAWLVLKYVF